MRETATMTLKESIVEACEQAQSHFVDRWSEWHDGPKGTRFRVRFLYDGDTNPFEYDSMGSYEHEKRNDYSYKGTRPSHFNGAARKLSTRDGAVWWQPPEDVVNDPKVLASIQERVQAWFHDEWTYLTMHLQLEGPTCSHCDTRPEAINEYLGGIESDSDDYFPEVADDLLAQALVEAFPHMPPE